MANEFSYEEIASITALTQAEIPHVYEEYHLRSSLDSDHLVELSTSIQRAVSQESIKRSFGKTIRASNYEAVPFKTDSKAYDPSFSKIINCRKSTRDFSNSSVSINDVGFIVGSLLTDTPTLQHRAYASAGACFPNEVFLNVRNVEGLKPGFYYLDLSDSSFRSISKKQEIFTLEEHEPQAALSFVLISLFARVTYKYGERGYRFALLEAGAMTQLIEMTANFIGLGAVSSGGFRDDLILKMCNLSSPQAGITAVVHVGSRNVI